MSSNSKNPRPISKLQPLIKSTYSPKTQINMSFPEDSPFTKQSFKDECDVNTIMARYLASGELPVINEQAPQYMDVTGMEFQAHMEFVAGAQSMFQDMPSSIRNRFNNSPAEFLDFVSQEKNRPELQEMGLLKPQNVPPIPEGQSSEKTSQNASTQASENKA